MPQTTGAKIYPTSPFFFDAGHPKESCPTQWHTAVCKSCPADFVEDVLLVHD